MGIFNFFKKGNSKNKQPSTQDIIIKEANSCVDYVKHVYDKSLNYSMESLTQIENFLEDECKQREEFSKDYTDEILFFRVSLYSAYVGETIRRNYGGEWFYEPPKDDQPLLEGGKDFVWQIKFNKRVLNRITNGKLYSITSYLNIFFERLEKATPGQVFAFDGAVIQEGKV